MGNRIKGMAKRFLSTSGSLRFAGRFATRGVAILRYHSVLEQPELFEDTIGKGIIHSRAVFEQQMQFVADECTPVGLDEVLACISGKSSLPARAVAVTFDDGFADNAMIAAPIMERLGIRGAFYVTGTALGDRLIPWFIRVRRAFRQCRCENWVLSGSGEKFCLSNPVERRTAFIKACEVCALLTGQRQSEWLAMLEDSLGVLAFIPNEPLMMNGDQIRMLRNAGHIIGSHTMTHPNVAQIDSDQALKELADSRSFLEELLGAPVRHFSYPSPILEPHWTAETVRLTATVGYQTAVTCTPGLVRKGDDPLYLKRIAVPLENDDFSWHLDATFLGRLV